MSDLEEWHKHIVVLVDEMHIKEGLVLLYSACMCKTMTDLCI